MDNTTLATAVDTELRRLGHLPELKVRTADGIVILGGQVPDETLSRRIEQALLALPEVLDVHNYLDVVPPCDGSEGELRAALEREGVAVNRLRVSIDHGVVTLAGIAACGADRDAIARAAWRLPGVREVVDRMSLPKGQPE